MIKSKTVKLAEKSGVDRSPVNYVLYPQRTALQQKVAERLKRHLRINLFLDPDGECDWMGALSQATVDFLFWG